MPFNNQLKITIKRTILYLGQTIPLIALTAGLNFASGAQEPQEQPAELFIDSTGQVYTRADQPAYLFIAPESNPNQLVAVPSSDQAANPMHWDGHGVHYIAHRDLHLNKTIRFRILADGVPPTTKLSFSSGLLFSLGNIHYAEVGAELIPKGEDQMSGVKQTFAALDGLPLAPAESYISLNEEREYTIEVYSVDNVGNSEESTQHRIFTSEDARVQMDNIFFNFNSSRLSTEAYSELNNLARLLIEHTGINLEIAAHTDSRGSKRYNQLLSEARAKSVVRYLANRGVPKDRLSASGYGETMPINECTKGVKCPEEKHKENRRVELIITKIDN